MSGGGDEFRLIGEIFAPLARDFPGAFGLTDDAAVIRPEPGFELVVTTDVMVAGVHFPAHEAAERIAAKLLRVNLSDLAAMGARPLAHLLGLALPEPLDESWLRAFAAGLAADQNTYGTVLAGGDTVATGGPLTLSLTALGQVREGRALRRSGARSGDLVFVSGTIGDGALGLLAARGELRGLEAEQRQYLAARHGLPEPRTELGPRLVGLASAAIDISDGLVADLGHLCRASGVAAVITCDHIPLSPAARAALKIDPSRISSVLGGGDDYELLFTVEAAGRGEIARLGRDLGLELTEIGRLEDGAGVTVLDGGGAPMQVIHEGYTHF